MKNLHILPTDKPSNLYFHKLNNRLGFSTPEPMGYEGSGSWAEGRNIYITSDEEIKEGDWILFQGILTKALEGEKFSGKEKIILTTDQDLIKDGVQAIDDEFLEWFVKNPSCEEVEIEYQTTGLKGGVWQYDYKIIIPKEEPKQETLEEYIERETKGLIEHNLKSAAKAYLSYGAKWQQERMYSDEEVIELNLRYLQELGKQQSENGHWINFKEWFEQFKNK